MRVAIYARVSSDEQAENTSLDTQVSAMQRYAEMHRMEIVNTFLEDYSGTKISRPKLDLVRELIRNRTVDAVIVYSPDRFTRSPAHGIQLREEFANSRIELHFTTRGKVDFGTAGELLSTIEDHMNKHWLVSLKEAAERGWAGKAASDQWVGRGKVPYGYMRIGKRNTTELQLDPEESLVVQGIFYWFVNDDFTVRRIADELNKAEVPTPGRSIQKKIPTRGIWVYKMVYTILNNPIYAGKHHAFVWKQIDGKKILQPQENRIVVSSPIIIEQDQWNLARQKLAEKSGISQSRKYNYLLSRRVRCMCGSAACGVPVKNATSFYYRCLTFNSPYRKHCGLKAFPVARVDAIVWDIVRQLIEDQEQLFSGFQGTQEEFESRWKKLSDRRIEIEEQIGRQQNQLRVIVQLIGDSGTYAQEVFEETRKRIDSVLRDLENEQKKIDADLKNSSFTAEQFVHFRAYIQRFREDLELLGDNFEGRKRVVDAIGVTAILEYKEGHRILHINWFKKELKTVDLDDGTAK